MRILKQNFTGRRSRTAPPRASCGLHGAAAPSGTEPGPGSFAARLLSSPARVFALAFVAVFLAMAAWSIASPLNASPDEPAHVARAAAVVRGEVLAHSPGGTSDAYTTVTIPAAFFPSHNAPCFAFQYDTPASCARGPSSSSAVVTAETYAGRYPPLYYAIVGIPSLAWQSPAGFYLMRLMSAALCSAFLALAIMTVATWSRRRLMLVGILLAATPQAFFLGGVVNPSGLEISAAICLWCAGLTLALEHRADPPVGLVAVVALSAGVWAMSRALSPLLLALSLCALVLLAGVQPVIRLARRRRDVQLAGGFILLCVVLTTVWVVTQHSFDLTPGTSVDQHLSHASVLAAAFGRTGDWVQQMIAVFGWVDTPAPLFVYLMWYAGIGFVVVLAWVASRRRDALVLGGLLVAVIVVPALLSYSQAERLGLVGQGRYTLPLAAGLPLIAMALIDGQASLSRLRGRIATLLCAGIGLGGVVAFVAALRRYTVGLAGPLNYLSARWNPPGGALVVSLWCVVAVVLLISLIRLLVSSPGPTATPPRLELGIETNVN